jgi:tRNA dimethylallyltransferase
MENKIIVIAGPTGVGKTKLSIALAHKYNGIIINADSMQVYKELNIGTAKITEKEKEKIPHYLLDIASLDQIYTVYDYQKDARKIINDNKDKTIIIVGGTGLYIKAALYNYEFKEETSYNTYDNLSDEELYNKVKAKYSNINIHLNNRQRLIRALNKEDEYSNKGNELLYPSIFIGLTTDRKNLYERINKRVDEMFNKGLLNEVKSLYDKGLNSKAINTGIGYKELYAYFNNEISLDEAKTLIKQRSRHYAKRQYTWFNNQMNIKWFDVNFNNFDETTKEVENYLDNLSITQK